VRECTRLILALFTPEPYICKGDRLILNRRLTDNSASCLTARPPVSPTKDPRRDSTAELDKPEPQWLRHRCADQSARLPRVACHERQVAQTGQWSAPDGARRRALLSRRASTELVASNSGSIRADVPETPADSRHCRMSSRYARRRCCFSTGRRTSMRTRGYGSA
jgi:hypothetical protein